MAKKTLTFDKILEKLKALNLLGEGNTPVKFSVFKQFCTIGLMLIIGFNAMAQGIVDTGYKTPVTININYGENELISFGVKFAPDYNYYVGISYSTNNLSETPKLLDVSDVKLGIGKIYNKSLYVGTDAIFTIFKPLTGSDVTKFAIGLNFTYLLTPIIGINFTSNNVTGNSIGLHLQNF